MSERGYEIIEVQIQLHDDRHDLVVLLGRDERELVGGWWWRSVAPTETMKALHDFLATGELDEGWNKGKPNGSYGGTLGRQKLLEEAA